MRLILYYVVVCSLFFHSACNEAKEKPPKVHEDKQQQVSVKRFEQDVFSMTPDQMKNDLASLQKKYPEFLVRFGQMLNIGNPEDSAFVINLAHFVADGEVRKVYEETQQKYASLQDVEKDLSESFTYYSHYFLGKKIPSVVSFVSGFNYAVAVGESFVGVGLDMYMGKDYRYYGLLQFPQFKMPFMEREYIATDMMRAWITTEFQNEDKSTELLNAMVHEGKVMYAMRKLFPEKEDSIRTGFSSGQLQWMEKNEKRIWTFMIDRKLLFNTNFSENTKYLNEAPFSPGMPKDSPGRTVVWIGYRIVDAYMKKHPETTLEGLLKLKDSRMILNSSGYKPMK